MPKVIVFLIIQRNIQFIDCGCANIQMVLKSERLPSKFQPERTRALWKQKVVLKFATKIENCPLIVPVVTEIW